MMLDFINLPEEVVIYKPELDDWGVATGGASGPTGPIGPTGIITKAYIREVIEKVELNDMKGNNVVVSFQVVLPGDVEVQHDNKIGIEVDGELKDFNIIKITKGKDLSGEVCYLKVYV